MTTTQLPLWMDDAQWEGAKERHPRLYQKLCRLSKEATKDDIDDDEYYRIIQNMSDIRERMMK